MDQHSKYQLDLIQSCCQKTQTHTGPNALPGALKRWIKCSAKTLNLLPYAPQSHGLALAAAIQLRQAGNKILYTMRGQFRQCSMHWYTRQYVCIFSWWHSCEHIRPSSSSSSSRHAEQYMRADESARTADGGRSIVAMRAETAQFADHRTRTPPACETSQLRATGTIPVSYTHLTLPTNREV